MCKWRLPFIDYRGRYTLAPDIFSHLDNTFLIVMYHVASTKIQLL